MRIVLTQAIMFGGELRKPGTVIECSKTLGKSLKQRGKAVEVKEDQSA